jgi:hypothetical protein
LPAPPLELAKEMVGILPPRMRKMITLYRQSVNC